MDNLTKLKEAILKEYPRLTENDRFSFECGPHLECFNACCADVNIFLTPYDVLRLRRALGLGSTEFLARHTIIPFDKNQKLPVPLLLMNDSAKKECSFVDADKGCTIYADRPWPCRMYPLGMASPGEFAEPGLEPFYFIMRDDVCGGLARTREWTVREWLEDQGIPAYEEFGELFKGVTLHQALGKGWTPNEKQIDLYWISLYDLDTFRRFIFESSFLDRFILDEATIKSLQNDDEALLRFGFNWVKMALFGERTIPIRSEAEAKIRASQSPEPANNG
ncbi:MAG: YkgJ family cysteine cluster protein [Calditrichota bacterium]